MVDVSRGVSPGLGDTYLNTTIRCTGPVTLYLAALSSGYMLVRFDVSAPCTPQDYSR